MENNEIGPIKRIRNKIKRFASDPFGLSDRKFKAVERSIEDQVNLLGPNGAGTVDIKFTKNSSPGKPPSVTVTPHKP